MKKAGIWLDHEKAFIVLMVKGEETLATVDSRVERGGRLSGGSRSKTPWGPQEKSSEQKKLERRKQQLQRYYDRILDEIRDTQAVLIMGPGEAKGELLERIESRKAFLKTSVTVEPADKMTEHQVVARVKAFYGIQVRKTHLR